MSALRHLSHDDFCGYHVDNRSGDCTCEGAKGGLPKRRGDWMQTFSGRQYWPLDPRPAEVFVEDIAHALAHLCRYAGHCERFYSVAEHSVHVSRCVPPEMALKALLHDATEAYCVDIPRPLKRFIPGYVEIEERNWVAIAQRFDLTPDMPDEIKYADNSVLLAEADQILKKHPAPWNIPAEPADVLIVCMRPEYAKAAFLQRFAELTAA